MARSSTSVPTSPLPFGADTHNHNAYHRSTTALGGHNQTQPDQDFSSFVAAAQAEDARSQRASASIPPSSVKDLPLGYRNLLRRHRILLWVLLAVFEISLIALTAGTVLCVVRAHTYNADGGGKAAFVIVGVFGFAGMVGSAAVGWLLWQGRKERARLEKRWTADEEMKERRSVRESSRANEVLRSIKERERSLSRSQSRSRGRATHRPPPATRHERPYSELIPSFRAMTPTATEAPSVATEQPRDSDWTNRLDLSTSEDEEYTRTSQQITNERLEHEIFEHMSRPTTPGTGSPNISGVLLARSPTLPNSSSPPSDGPVAQSRAQGDRSQGFVSSPQSPTLFDFSALDRASPSPPPKSPLPALLTARSSPVLGRPHKHPATSGSYGPSPTTQNTSILDFSPIIDPPGGIHPAYRNPDPFGLPPDLRSSRQNVNEPAPTSIPTISSSPAVPGSPRQSPTTGSIRQLRQNPQPHSSPSSTRSPTLLNSSPVTAPVNIATAAIHPAFRNSPSTSHPTSPQPSQQNSNPGTGTGTASTLLNPPPPPPNNLTQLQHTLPPTPTTQPPTATPPTLSPPQHSPPPIIRARNRTLTSAQSDDNFQAMLAAGSDANSEDEARLAARRVRSHERVRAWAGEVGVSGGMGARAPCLTGREEDAGGVVRRGLGRVGGGLRRFGIGAKVGGRLGRWGGGDWE